MARTAPSGIRNRRTQIVAFGGAFVVLLSLALPRLMASGAGLADDPSRKPRKEPPPRYGEQVDARDAQAGTATHASSQPRPTDTKGPAGRVDVEHVARAADDLDVALSLRWSSYRAGTAIRARVVISNRDERPVWIPAHDEPQRTLAIRILDEGGVTVRHVVEEVVDPLPRKMRRLGPGESATVEIDVVAHGEKPLPPGRYQLTAVYEADEAWLRSGLPVWRAPKGARHSDRVAFEVTAR